MRVVLGRKTALSISWGSTPCCAQVLKQLRLPVMYKQHFPALLKQLKRNMLLNEASALCHFGCLFCLNALVSSYINPLAELPCLQDPATDEPSSFLCIILLPDEISVLNDI